MPNLNRFQIVAVIAGALLLLGIFRAAKIFAGLSGGGGADITFASRRTIALPADDKETFVKIGRQSARDPFSAPSRWREPQPEDMDMPPLGDLLGLQPTPLLLRQDGLPRIGPPPGAREDKLDRELLTRVRRVFPQGVKADGAGAPGAVEAPAAASPAGTAEEPKAAEPPPAGTAEEPKAAEPPAGTEAPAEAQGGTPR